jgi:hypothetical protein
LQPEGSTRTVTESGKASALRSSERCWQAAQTPAGWSPGQTCCGGWGFNSRAPERFDGAQQAWGSRPSCWCRVWTVPPRRPNHTAYSAISVLRNLIKISPWAPQIVREGCEDSAAAPGSQSRSGADRWDPHHGLRRGPRVPLVAMRSGWRRPCSTISVLRWCCHSSRKAIKRLSDAKISGSKARFLASLSRNRV